MRSGRVGHSRSSAAALVGGSEGAFTPTNSGGPNPRGSLYKGQSYITAVHDLDAKRLLFATEGRDHQTVVDFAADLKAHGGDPEQVRHVCQDMSAAYAKGVGMALPNTAISCDRFHVVAMAVDAMDKVRQAEMRDQPKVVAKALGTTERKTIKGLMWGMRKNPGGWTRAQTDTMH